jgi:hypothetical protein
LLQYHKKPHGAGGDEAGYRRREWEEGEWGTNSFGMFRGAHCPQEKKMKSQAYCDPSTSHFLLTAVAQA